MWMINRWAVIVTPKEPFVKWLNNLPDRPEGHQWDMEAVQENPHVYLTDNAETEDEARQILKPLVAKIFMSELAAWCPDEELWPENRTAQMFNEWFETKLHDMVIDTSGADFEGEPFE